MALRKSISVRHRVLGEEDEVLAARAASQRVAGAPVTELRARDDLDVEAAGLQDGHRFVVARGVDRDSLHVTPVVLAIEGSEETTQVVRAVQGRDEDGDGGRGHGPR